METNLNYKSLAFLYTTMPAKRTFRNTLEMLKKRIRTRDVFHLMSSRRTKPVVEYEFFGNLKILDAFIYNFKFWTNSYGFMVMQLAFSGSCLFLGIREDTRDYASAHPLKCDFTYFAKNLECTNIFSYKYIEKFWL